MSIITARSHGFKLAEALGIPTHRLRGFHLHCVLNEAVTIDATYLVEDADGTLYERVKRLQLLVAAPQEVDATTLHDTVQRKQLQP